MLLILPGQRSARLVLDEILRERHDVERARVAREIKTREESGAPLVDEVTGLPIVALDDYEPEPLADGVEVVLRARSMAERQRDQERIAAAFRDGDKQRIADALECHILSSYAEIHGVRTIDPETGYEDELPATAFSERPDMMRAMIDVGLAALLVVAANHWSALDPKAVALCGRRQQRTSMSSSAPAAQQSAGPSSAATATPSSRGSPEPITKGALAPGDYSSTTRRWPGHSSFVDELANTSGSMPSSG